MLWDTILSAHGFFDVLESPQKFPISFCLGVVIPHCDSFICRVFRESGCTSVWMSVCCLLETLLLQLLLLVP